MYSHRFSQYFCIHISNFDSQQNFQGKKRKFLKRPETSTVYKINQISGKPQQLGVKIKGLGDLCSKYQGISAKCRTLMCMGTCMQRFSHSEIPNYLFDNIFLYRITVVIYRLMFPIKGIQS